MDEREQVREVYAVSAGRLVAQLYALTGDFGEAQDVVHEAFAKALVRPGQLARADNPEAWLRTVAVNLARSRYRRRAVFDRLVRTGRVDRPEASVPGLSPDRVALVAALQRLPHAVRESIVLHHLADLPVAEIAAVLGCSPSTVKARLVRGRRALSELLGEDDPVVALAPDPEPDPPGVLAAGPSLSEAHHA
ncbi:SigE family RNA polymerase sigma factor [Rugosimonospora acidiphila]|uniref:SigE family RNA polymerase sigma factor n=1 Tax=Rugosimonospora acidiphila TaxID=556531 RepID=A0ABP9RX86_9ACTN